MVNNLIGSAEKLRQQACLSYPEIGMILDELNTCRDPALPFGIVDYKTSPRKDIVAVYLMGSAGTKDFKTGKKKNKNEKYSDFDFWIILNDAAFASRSSVRLKEHLDRVAARLNSPHPFSFWIFGETMYREWKFIDNMQEDSYLGLARQHLKDYFLATKTLVAGRNPCLHEVSSIPPYEGYELSIIALMQAYRGSPAKAALRAALATLIAHGKILPLSLLIETEASKLFTPNLSRAKMIQMADTIPTSYELILQSAREQSGTLFSENEIDLLSTCYLLKGGITPEDSRIHGRDRRDLGEKKNFIDQVLKFITRMQIKLKEDYMKYLKSDLNKEQIIQKLTDLKIYTRMLLSWESRHIVNNLIKNLRIKSIFLVQDEEDVFEIQYQYQDGFFIRSRHTDLVDALGEISRVPDAPELIRFKGSIYHSGLDRKGGDPAAETSLYENFRATYPARDSFHTGLYQKRSP